MALDIGEIVRVTTRIATGGVPREAFNRGLLVTLDDSLAPSGANKVRLFTAADDVEDALGSGDANDAAAIWFSADPQPQGLYVGRWQPTDIDTILRGGTPAAFDSGALDAANGSFILNGTEITGINLTAADTGAAIALDVQAAIRAETAFANWTVTYDTANSRFVLTADGSTPITGGGLGDTTATSDTDIAAALGLDAASATHLPGTSAETITAALNSIIDETSGGEPVYLMLDDSAQARAVADGVIDDIRTWAQANTTVYALRDTADQVVAANDATSEPALAFAAQQQYVSAVYAADDEYPDIGLMARMSSQDFNQPASIISPQGDTLPGVEPVSLSSSQLAELDRKLTNTYATVNGEGALLGGYTSRTGYWLDAVVFLQWLRSELESGIWRAMRASRRFTSAQLSNALVGVMETAVASGGLRPGGTVSAATAADIRQTTGNQRFDGTLSRGYLIWVQNRTTAAVRDARIARFKVWIAGAEAIHSVRGDVTFTN